MDTKVLGGRGEDLAVGYLERLGWRIRARNWRCSAGELDIVADETGTDTLVFCEVKCRSGLGFGDPLEAITHAKLAKLKDLALAWLAQEGRHGGPIRIDGIGVVLRRGYAPAITHVRGIGS